MRGRDFDRFANDYMREAEEDMYKEWERIKRQPQTQPEPQVKVVYELPEPEKGEYAVHIPVNSFEEAEKQKVDKDLCTQFLENTENGDFYVRWYDETKGKWSEFRKYTITPEPEPPEQLNIDDTESIDDKLSYFKREVINEVKGIVDEIKKSLKTQTADKSKPKTVKSDKPQKPEQASIFDDTLESEVE